MQPLRPRTRTAKRGKPVGTSVKTFLFTDSWTQTFKIDMYKEITMPKEECNNDSTEQCTKGLHVGTKHFMKDYQINTSLKEQIILKVLVNPLNVVATPEFQNGCLGKIRTCSYFPIHIYKNHEEIQEENGFKISTKYMYKQK